MRYAQGGGVDAAGRARREALRLEAAALFVQGVSAEQVAVRLRVSERSAYRWKTAWVAGGSKALSSKGPLGPACRLSPRLQAKLAAMLEQGLAAHGWDDQVWTGARVATLIGRMFHKSYSPSAAIRLMRRLGFTPQMPTRRAVQRDEAAVAAWRAPGGRWTSARQRLAAVTGAYLCFEDEAGQSLTPPRSRTWGRRGVTPVVTVNGRSSGRVSIAGLIAVRPGARTRWFYRLRVHRPGRRTERRSLSERDCIGLIDAAHQQLNAPIILIWDRLNTHVSRKMKLMIDARQWLTVILLPAYAPDLNPVEWAWAHLKRRLANLAAGTLNRLEALIRTQMKSLQHRPDLLDGFITGTGLTFEPQ
jgi:transposase